MQVYVLQHEYERDGFAEVKIIGVYQSRQDADSAVRRMRTLPGFKECQEGFSIDPFDLGVDHWTTGFVTVVTQRSDQAA